jgi:hypothetical protein
MGAVAVTVFRLTATVTIDTGTADAFGLEQFVPRELAGSFKRLLDSRVWRDPEPRPQIGTVVVVISDDGPEVLFEQAGVLTRAMEADHAG